MKRIVKCITQPIYVEDNVYIGIRSIILPEVHIGRNVIIGAGSVVTKDIQIIRSLSGDLQEQFESLINILRRLDLIL